MAIDIAQHSVQSETRPAPRTIDLSFRTKKVGSKERMFFTERVSLLLETGVPLHAALEALKRQVQNTELTPIIDDVMDDIAGGRAFSEALAKHPTVFSSTYVNLVAAGEKGGFLAEVLRQILSMDEKQEKLRAVLSSALSYPVFLIFFSLAVVLFILTVVFPKFSEFFHAIRDQLPVTTIFLMAVSDILRQYWIVVIGGLAAGALALARWVKRPETRRWVDRCKLRIPLIKDVFVQLYLIHSLRVLSLSMANGVSLLDALGSCRDVVRNVVFRGFIERAETLVSEGRGLSPAFQETHFIPAIVRQMISTGEEAGGLPLVMGRVADFYERELEKKVTALSKMAEPIMLLVMGVLVGLIVSSLILPIFKLSRAVR